MDIVCFPRCCQRALQSGLPIAWPTWHFVSANMIVSHVKSWFQFTRTFYKWIQWTLPSDVWMGNKEWISVILGCFGHWISEQGHWPSSQWSRPAFCPWRILVKAWPGQWESQIPGPESRETWGSLEEARQRGGMETEPMDMKVRVDLCACLSQADLCACLDLRQGLICHSSISVQRQQR